MKTMKEHTIELMTPIMLGEACVASVAVGEHGQYLAGIPSAEFYHDADTNVEIACLTAEYYSQIAAGQWDLYNAEARAIGQSIKYAEFGIPDIDQTNPIIKSENDLDKIKWPDDPLKCGTIPEYVRTLELFEKYAGMPPSMYSAITSAFTLACGICSYAGMMKFIKRSPELAHEILRRCTYDILVPYIKAIHAKFPDVLIKLSDAWEMVPNVSPKIQVEYGFDYYDKLRDAVEPDGAIIEWWLAYSEKNFPNPKEYIRGKLKYNSTVFCPSTEVDVVPYSVYQEVALEEDASLMLGLPSTAVYDGPPEAIIEHSRMLFNVKGDIPLHQFNVIVQAPYSTKPEYIIATGAAFKAFSLVTDNNYDAVKVEPPKLTQSFGDFVRNKAKENPDGYSFKWLGRAKFYGE